MRREPLNEGKSVTLAGGAGQVELGPNGLEQWKVTAVAVITSTNTAEPTAKVYVDTVSPTAFLSGTYTGSNDSSNENVLLRQGQKLICVWSGGDSGATATLSVWGEKIYGF